VIIITNEKSVRAYETEEGPVTAIAREGETVLKTVYTANSPGGPYQPFKDPMDSMDYHELLVAFISNLMKRGSVQEVWTDHVEAWDEIIVDRREERHLDDEGNEVSVEFITQVDPLEAINYAAVSVMAVGKNIKYDVPRGKRLKAFGKRHGLNVKTFKYETLEDKK